MKLGQFQTSCFFFAFFELKNAIKTQKEADS